MLVYLPTGGHTEVFPYVKSFLILWKVDILQKKTLVQSNLDVKMIEKIV